MAALLSVPEAATRGGYVGVIAFETCSPAAPVIARRWSKAMRTCATEVSALLGLANLGMARGGARPCTLGALGVFSHALCTLGAFYLPPPARVARRHGPQRRW